jgi:hypothetical protein
LFHLNSWFEQSKDYSSFLKDRLDTIRVYRSVNGNMSGLQDYYCTTGLEHFLHLNHPLTLKRIQKQKTSAVVTLHLRQKLLQQNDPESLRQLATHLSLEARQQAQKRADSSSYVSTTGSIDGKSQADVDEEHLLTGDGTGYSHTGNLAKPMHPFSHPIPTMKASCGKFFPVDVRSLREMNSQLLETLRSKAERTTNSDVGKDTVSSSATLNTIFRGSEQWESLNFLSADRRDSFSTAYRPSSSTVLEAMNCALAITNVCSDPVSAADSSMNMSSVTSISAVRKDKLASPRGSITVDQL